METVRIFPLRDLSKPERLRLKAVQMEAARVWMYCVQRHQQARANHLPWPGRRELQEETKGGQYALHSQSIQMITHQFLANVETIAKLRQTDKRHRYPYHPKKYLTVDWPAQAIDRHGNTLTLPMGADANRCAFISTGCQSRSEPSPSSGMGAMNCTSSSPPLGPSRFLFPMRLHRQR